MFFREFLLLLFWACMPSHSQLGESKAAREIKFSFDDSSEQQSEHQNGIVYDGPETETQLITFRSMRWSSVETTYQGCLSENYIEEGTFLYVNLSMIAVNINASTEAAACYELCFRHDPFSMYLSVNMGLGHDNDVCGCHGETELQLSQMEYYDSQCDKNTTFSRIYCGPENVPCYNRAPFVTIPSLLFILFITFINTHMNVT